MLDQYAAEQLLDLSRATELRHAGEVIARVYRNADAVKIYKFVVSVAWRASISGHVFYRRVQLGPLEKNARGLILGNHDNDSAIEVGLAEYDIDSVPVLDPHATRFDQARFWLIYANRFIFYVKADRRPMPRFFDRSILVGGRPVVSIVRNYRSSKERNVQIGIVRANPRAFKP